MASSTASAPSSSTWAEQGSTRRDPGTPTTRWGRQHARRCTFTATAATASTATTAAAATTANTTIAPTATAASATTTARREIRCSIGVEPRAGERHRTERRGKQHTADAGATAAPWLHLYPRLRLDRGVGQRYHSKGHASKGRGRCAAWCAMSSRREGVCSRWVGARLGCADSRIPLVAPVLGQGVALCRGHEGIQTTAVPVVAGCGHLPRCGSSGNANTEVG
jgi:hypothetical protein